MSKRRAQRLLEDLMSELGKLAKARSQQAQVVVEHSPDLFDEAQSAMDMEMAIAGLNSDWETARAIEEAIERVKAGEYGLCESCQKPIPARRLQAIPWARCCVRCQEAWEKAQDEAETYAKVA